MSMPVTSTSASPPSLARAPQPTPAQAAAYAAWYERQFGVVLEPTEAAIRLAHVAHLIFLLGGAEWLRQRRRSGQTPPTQTPVSLRNERP
jgi:hypothetical protein